mgnify:CR=1 FL=1
METIKKDGLVIEINRHKLQIEKIYEVIVIRFINRR